MSRKLAWAAITMLMFWLPALGISYPRRVEISKVVLLPIEQSNIDAVSNLSDKQLSEAMLVQLTRSAPFLRSPAPAFPDASRGGGQESTGVELVRFAELSKAFNKQLVDDAVFELLVTDDLKHTLARLDALETKSAKLTEYCKIGKEIGINHLVAVSIGQDFTQLRVTYTVYDTATSRIANAKSFYDVPNDPIGVSDELAKRIVRSLWQLKS